MAEKKETLSVCKPHHYIVTGWAIKGGHQQATKMRCSHCLQPAAIDILEQQEWRDKEGI